MVADGDSGNTLVCACQCEREVANVMQLKCVYAGKEINVKLRICIRARDIENQVFGLYTWVYQL